MEEKIVQATIVLHNYLLNAEINVPLEDRKHCPTGYADYIDNNGAIQPGAWRDSGENLRSVNRQGSNYATRSARGMRDVLADYFVSEVSSLPWQGDYVNRGGMAGYL